MKNDMFNYFIRFQCDDAIDDDSTIDSCEKWKLVDWWRSAFWQRAKTYIFPHKWKIKIKIKWKFIATDVLTINLFYCQVFFLLFRWWISIFNRRKSIIDVQKSEREKVDVGKIFRFSWIQWNEFSLYKNWIIFHSMKWNVSKQWKRLLISPFFLCAISYENNRLNQPLLWAIFNQSNFGEIDNFIFIKKWLPIMSSFAAAH